MHTIAIVPILYKQSPSEDNNTRVESGVVQYSQLVLYVMKLEGVLLQTVVIKLQLNKYPTKLTLVATLGRKYNI